MRRLSLIVIWLAASCPSSAQDQKARFVEFPMLGHTITYDLSTVQIIQPGRFSITQTEIDDPDVMRFELKALATFRTYCSRADGHYPPAAYLLTLGPADKPVKDIEVRSDQTRIGNRVYQTKLVSWDYPYERLGTRFGFLNCKQNDRTEAQLYGEAARLITNGIRSKMVYDCKRGLHGLGIEHDDPAKALMAPVRKGTWAHTFYLSVCRAVTHEVPYMPEE